MTWILILAFMSLGYPTAITHIPDFVSQQECEDAAKQFSAPDKETRRAFCIASSALEGKR